MSDHQENLNQMEDQVSRLEQEARMVLPGIQALFGFQLMCVFNPTFGAKLVKDEQVLHLIATTFTLLTIILMLTPGAYHRQKDQFKESQYFIIQFSHFITIGMFFLALAICIDFFLIARIILNNYWISVSASVMLMLLFCGFWFLYPQCKK